MSSGECACPKSLALVSPIRFSISYSGMLRFISVVSNESSVRSRFFFLVSSSFHRVAQSQCLGYLVTYFSESHTETEAVALWYGVGLVFCAFLSSAITNPYLMYSFQSGLQIRVGLSAMIYNKVLDFETNIKV